MFFLPFTKGRKSDCQKTKDTVPVLSIFQHPLLGHMLCKTAYLAAEANVPKETTGYTTKEGSDPRIQTRRIQLGVTKQPGIYLLNAIQPRIAHSVWGGYSMFRDKGTLE